MKNPKLAALFANASNGGHEGKNSINTNKKQSKSVSFLIKFYNCIKIQIIIIFIGFEYEIDNRRLIADEDEEDYEYEEIDLDNLPNDQ